MKRKLDKISSPIFAIFGGGSAKRRGIDQGRPYDGQRRSCLTTLERRSKRPVAHAFQRVKIVNEFHFRFHTLESVCHSAERQV
jgi:hypothetical protein